MAYEDASPTPFFRVHGLLIPDLSFQSLFYSKLIFEPISLDFSVVISHDFVSTEVTSAKYYFHCSLKERH